MATAHLDSYAIIGVLALCGAVILVYQYRHLFSFLRYRWMLKSAAEAKAEPRRPTGVVCPRCSDVMEEGYLLGPRGIYWNRDATSLHTFGWHDVRSEALTPRFPFSEKTGMLRAYRCVRCEIIRVDLKSQNRMDFF